jgi:hypothetical protein
VPQFPLEQEVYRELQCQCSQGNRKCAGGYSASIPRGTVSVQGATVPAFKLLWTVNIDL